MIIYPSYEDRVSKVGVKRCILTRKLAGDRVWKLFRETSFPLLLTRYCCAGAQLATAWSTGGTCTVCGPTMSNYSLPCTTIK